MKTCKKGLHEYDVIHRTCPECKRVYKKIWDEVQKKLGRHDPKAAVDRAMAWQKANKERHYKHCQSWLANKPWKTAFHLSKRRAYKLHAIPKWADLNAIENFYKNCPDGYEVDHIIPFKGKNVSGLHVHNNLQYLTPSQNRSKGNKHG